MENYSYVTLLSDDSYIYGIILLYQSLKQVESKYSLFIMVTPNVNPPILNILDQLNLKYEIVDPIEEESIKQFNEKAEPAMARTWALCLSKFHMFNMNQFKKIVFLDADILVLKNLDHLFELPHLTSALDGEYFNLWPSWPHFNSGVLVIEPDKQIYNNLLYFIKNEAIKKWTQKTCIADQEILNMYYSNWPNQKELHLNKYYDIFAPYILEEQLDDIKENCYFIHFVGRKPWRAFHKPQEEKYSEYYYTFARKIITDYIKTLNWDQAKDNIKIAVYAICKDELKNVQRFINCFSKADYLCILDTGSTDGTWQILLDNQKIYPNLIIDQQIIDPWRYDTARNLSLKLVPKDTTMYFMADLDEIIKEDNWPYLIRAAWDPLFSRGQYTYYRQVDKITDQPIHTFYEYRIHNNIWHYKGIVHEQLVNNGIREFYLDECIKVPIKVWHYPTIINRPSYISLCERGVQEEPFNWLMHLQLAAEYEIHELYDKAIEEYKIIITEEDVLAPAEIGRCYAGLGRALNMIGKKRDGLQVLKKGIITVPTCGDNYYFAAEIQYQLGNFEQAFNLCVDGIKNSTMNEWCTIISTESHFPYIIMGLSQFYLGNKVLGLGYISMAREKNNTEYVNNIYAWMNSQINNGR